MANRHEHFEIAIDATPDEVWRMLTTSEGIATWFGMEASIDFRVDGVRTVGWAGNSEFSARITEIENQRKLTLTYVGEGEIGVEEWLIESDGTTTYLRLIHSMPDDGIDDWEGFYGDMRRGWTLFMNAMKHALEVAVPTNRIVEAVFPRTSDRRATWDRINLILADSEDLVAGMDKALVIEPHTLFLTAPDRTLMVDQEGSGENHVIFIQAATFGGPDEWRADVLNRFAAAGH